MNHVILLANLTRDPELRYTPNQVAIASFGVAANRRWKDKDGNDKSEVCFVDCEMWGARGEAINKYFSKGDQILLSGRLTFDSWTAQDGTKRNKLKVTVENFEFVGQKEKKEQDNGQGFHSSPTDSDVPF